MISATLVLMVMIVRDIARQGELIAIQMFFKFQKHEHAQCTYIQVAWIDLKMENQLECYVFDDRLI